MASPVVAQYFFFQDEGDRTWTVKFREDIPYAKLTRLYVWPAWLDNGLLILGMQTDPDSPTRVEALTAACRQANPGAEVYISSGYDDGEMYLEAAKDPGRFADSVVAFLRRYGLDGYDMDWENGLETQPLNDLATALRSAFDTAGAEDGKHYGLTLATWPKPDRAYDMSVLAAQLDAINIMSYGVDESLEGCAQAYEQQGFPAAKMIGGVDTENGYLGGVDTIGSDGSIAEKAQYALQNGLAGMMEWRLDNDYVVDDISTYKGADQLWESMHA